MIGGKNKEFEPESKWKKVKKMTTVNKLLVMRKKIVKT